MGDKVEANSGGDTNFAKDNSVVVNIRHDLGSLLSDLKKNNIDPEYQDRLREAWDKVSELQREMSDLIEENLSLRKENRVLQDMLEIKNKMKFERPFYYAEEAGKKDGPFCSKCWDDESKPMRLYDCGNDRWWCPKCKIHIPGANYVAPKPPERKSHKPPLDRWRSKGII